MARKIKSLGGYAMKLANKRRMSLDLQEILVDDKGNRLKQTRKGKLVKR